MQGSLQDDPGHMEQRKKAPLPNEDQQAAPEITLHSMPKVGAQESQMDVFVVDLRDMKDCEVEILFMFNVNPSLLFFLSVFVTPRFAFVCFCIPSCFVPPSSFLLPPASFPAWPLYRFSVSSFLLPLSFLLRYLRNISGSPSKCARNCLS